MAGRVVGPGFEGAAPAEVAWQVLGGDAVETVDPLLEAAVVGVDIVDVQVGRRGSRLSRRRHGVKGDLGPAREGGQRLAAIPNEMICGRNDARQRRGDRGAVVVRQNGVEGRPLPVAGDEDGNVVLIGAGMSGRSAPPARLARQVGPTALEGFDDEGLIRPRQFRSTFEACPPAGARKNRCRQRKAVLGMHAAEFRGLSQAHALDHPLGMIEPALLLAQMRQRRFGQRIEHASATRPRSLWFSGTRPGRRSCSAECLGCSAASPPAWGTRQGRRARIASGRDMPRASYARPSRSDCQVGNDHFAQRDCAVGDGLEQLVDDRYGGRIDRRHSGSIEDKPSAGP